jgi:hypothetical protein
MVDAPVRRVTCLCGGLRIAVLARLELKDNHIKAWRASVVIARGKLALVSALCLLASASAYAAGEFEARIRTMMMERAKKSEVWNAAIPQGISDRLWTCLAAAVVGGLSTQEVGELDAAATGGPDPNLALADKALGRLRSYMQDVRKRDFEFLRSVCPEDITDFHNHILVPPPSV